MQGLSEKLRRSEEFRNFTSLADDANLALRDYLKGQFSDSLLDSGIKFCKELLEGYTTAESEVVRRSQIGAREKFVVLRENNDYLGKHNLDMEKARDSLKEALNVLTDIRMNRSRSYSEIEIREIQRLLVALSNPFWNKSFSDLREAKLVRGRKERS